jgi:hypothetical protein
MSNETATVSETADRPFGRALRNAVADVRGISGLILAAVGIVGAYVALRDAIQLSPPWPIVGSLVPIPLFLLFYVWPEWRDAVARKRLSDYGVRGRLKEPGYFRLTPYDVHDSQRFVRPDDADLTVCRWINESSSQFIYLFGQSGVGKSSLLGASVLPKLGQTDAGWHVIAIRPHNDPIAAIKRGLCNNTQIWQDAPDTNADLLHLLDRATTQTRLHNKRLLIAIDQFEEVLILLPDEQRQSLISAFRDLANHPLPALTILLSLRSEYLSDIESLALPPPTLSRNCLEVRPFSRAAAQDFIENSELDVGPGLMKEVFEEVAEIEDMPDRVRPIVLNMIGLVLASFKGALPKGINPGRLLSGYVRRAMSAKDVQLCAADVLRPLITYAGTKRSLPLATIAEQSRLSSSVARGCLLRLADSGLVRATDHASSSWEISHDFVVRLVQPIAQNWTKTFWEMSKNWIGPSALGAWVIAVSIGAYVYPNWSDERVRKELDQAGIVAAPAPKDGGLAFKYNGQSIDDDNFKKATGYLAKIHGPITSVDFRDARQLTSLKGIYLPTTLTSLFLSGSLTSIAELPPLPALTYLSVSSGTSLADLHGMPMLPNLKELDLSGCQDFTGMPIFPALRRLSISTYILDKVSLGGIPSLPSLAELDIYASELLSLKDLKIQPAIQSIRLRGTNVSSLAGMPVLPTLTSLALEGTSLKNLIGMPTEPALEKLIIGTTFTGSGLVSLIGMPPLPALKTLEINNTAITDLDGMRAFTSLKTLRLSNLSALQNLSHMPVLPALEKLVLASIPKLKTFEGMPSQPALRTLTMQRAFVMSNGLESFTGMPNLPALDKLILDESTNLTSFDGMPNFAALATLQLGETGITNLASLPGLPKLQRLVISNVSLDLQEKLERISSSTGINERRKKVAGIKTLADIPDLPNLTEFSLNERLIETIPDSIRVQKIELYQGADELLWPLERFKSSLRQLSIHHASSSITDWNSIGLLSNLEGLEIDTDNFPVFDFLMRLPNLKRLKLSGQQAIDLRPLSALTRQLEITLDSDNRETIKLPSGSNFEIKWWSKDSRTNDADD